MNWEELEKLQTPCFIFDEEALKANFNDFNNALHTVWGKNSCVAYSVKTNPFPWVLQCAKSCGCMAEVVSNEEYSLALDEGFAPEEIIFNGPIKGKEWFIWALKHGSIVNVDSEREVRWLEELASDLKTKGKEGADQLNKMFVGVRANIDLDSFVPGETVTGKNKGRFGFSFEGGSLAQVITRLRSTGVVIAGLHMHVTTLSRSQKVYKVLASHAAKIISENNLSDTLRFVDMGGGFYGGGEANLGAYDEYAKTITAELDEVCDTENVALYVEPGGAVICTPGYYLGRIIDTKDVLGKRFVVSELSRINVDHEMKKISYAHMLSTQKKENYPEQVLCGYTCMESDRMCILHDEPELSEGDMVLIKNAGAYSMSFTPDFFIQYPPAVYAKTQDGFIQVRKPFDKMPPK